MSAPGFHPELSGRENVLLNGVILGLSRARGRARATTPSSTSPGLDAAFMDTPVKHYSSGMYARLAFAVAVHVEPDVLLVDEVLSVGDAAFQDRSLRRMLEFRDQGRAAIVFVSHNLAAIELMCQRAIWLERGSVARASARPPTCCARISTRSTTSATNAATAYVSDRPRRGAGSPRRSRRIARRRRAVHRARRWPARCGSWSNRCSS